jgi:hypothetical protein
MIKTILIELIEAAVIAALIGGPAVYYLLFTLKP